MKKASQILLTFELVFAELGLLDAIYILVTGGWLLPLNKLWIQVFGQSIDFVYFVSFYISYSVIKLLLTFVIFLLSLATYRKDEPKLVFGILQIALIGRLCIPGGIFYIIWSTQKKDHEQILEDNNERW